MNSQVETFLGLLLPADKIGVVKGFLGGVRVDSPPSMLAVGLKAVGLKDESTAARLIALMQKHAPRSDMTILEFMKSPEFATILTGKEPEGSPTLQCPHCREWIFMVPDAHIEHKH